MLTGFKGQIASVVTFCRQYPSTITILHPIPTPNEVPPGAVLIPRLENSTDEREKELRLCREHVFSRDTRKV
ncbi:hypothetical protein C0Q70_02646 [Pomacea canaliculata]|uniref:Uncharacterized protein n=1 Tax=Pomacea canaliculata TaxID=400727 RepID=A0A2T7PQI1_POMCA|nr:hypothetical protein C0Q70_02646 [Pomacea canaliculata]